MGSFYLRRQTAISGLFQVASAALVRVQCCMHASRRHRFRKCLLTVRPSHIVIVLKMAKEVSFAVEQKVSDIFHDLNTFSVML